MPDEDEELEKKEKKPEVALPGKVYMAAFLAGLVIAYIGFLSPQDQLYLSPMFLTCTLLLALPILLCQNTIGIAATVGGSAVAFAMYFYLNMHAPFFITLAILFKYMLLLTVAIAAAIFVEVEGKLEKFGALFTPALLYPSLHLVALFVLMFTPLAPTISFPAILTEGVVMLAAGAATLSVSYCIGGEFLSRVALESTKKGREKGGRPINPVIAELEDEFEITEIERSSTPPLVKRR